MLIQRIAGALFAVATVVAGCATVDTPTQAQGGRTGPGSVQEIKGQYVQEMKQLRQDYDRKRAELIVKFLTAMEHATLGELRKISEERSRLRMLSPTDEDARRLVESSGKDLDSERKEVEHQLAALQKQRQAHQDFLDGKRELEGEKDRRTMEWVERRSEAELASRLQVYNVRRAADRAILTRALGFEPTPDALFELSSDISLTGLDWEFKMLYILGTE